MEQYNIEKNRNPANMGKKWEKSIKLGIKVVPKKGLEPLRCRHRQILSLLRLPFRHSGTMWDDSVI